MSTQFLKQYDNYVLRETRKAVKNIQMPLPTDTDVIITGFERKPLYPRGSISDVSGVEREPDQIQDADVTTTPLSGPSPSSGSSINTPIGMTHYGATMYNYGATVPNIGAFHRTTTHQLFFVVGHHTPGGEQIEIPVGFDPARVKGANYLSKLKKQGHFGTGFI